MNFFQVLILAAIQGACELLPVSSSAHVIIAEKLMGIDPTSPAMTLFLVMLHTGTMFAVIFYFWKSWQKSFFQSKGILWQSVKQIAVASAFTLGVGLVLKTLIEKIFMSHVPHYEIELLFGNLLLIACALASVGLLIIFAARQQNKQTTHSELRWRESVWIGIIQGICLPFRGFSRSGATISTGMILGVSKMKAEEFSFALAVVLTPPVIARELHRLLKTAPDFVHSTQVMHLILPSLIGGLCSFLAGLVALKWLSSWLEHGRWHFFGYYCLFASMVVLGLHFAGY